MVEHGPGVLRQDRQQRPFGGAQPNLASLAGDSARTQINDDVAAVHYMVRTGRGMRPA